MTFLAPGFLFAAGLIASAVVAIHFIVTHEPRPVPLPTARFAPSRPVRTRSRRLRLQDLLLMLLRALVILAVGAALARPVLDPPRRELARILVVDRSRDVADPAEAADSASALLAEGDAVVLFDTAARVVREGATDSLAALTRSPGRGRLSAALVAALRTASAMRERADSFELVVVSPFTAGEADPATDSIRALWPAAVRLVRVAARADSAASDRVELDGEADDPLRFALPERRLAPDSAGSGVRVVRGAADAADSAWAAAGARALVHWPATHGDDGDSAAAVLPPPWAPRAAPDSVGAVIAGEVVVVAPFERRLAYDAAAAGGPGREDGDARVLARWVDGTPAAVETPHGAGCIRTVAVGVPSRGDLVIRPRFRRLVGALTGPCGGERRTERLDSTRLAALAGAGLDRYAAGSALPGPEVVPSPLAPWLFAAALVFALSAIALQRRSARGATAVIAGGDA